MMQLACSDCHHEIDLDEYPVHDVCLRERSWPYDESTRVDDVYELITSLSHRITTLKEDPVSDKLDSQALFESLQRDIAEQQAAEAARQEAMLEYVRQETARQQAEQGK